MNVLTYNAPDVCVDLAVFVLSYNGLHILEEYLSSVLNQGHIVIVDNGSTDGTREVVRTRWPGVTLVRLPHNVGLGAALNAAVKAVPSRNIILMNNDVSVVEDALRRLSRLLDSDSTIGIAAPKLLNPDGTVQGFGNDLGLSGLPATPKRVSAPLLDTFFQAGCVTAMRREQFLALGGYSEFFEWFYEDVDLAWKYRNAGLRVVVDGRCACIHFLGATLGHASREVAGTAASAAHRRRRYYSTRNVLLMFLRNAPWYQFLLQVPFIVVRQLMTSPHGARRRRYALVRTYGQAWYDAAKMGPLAVTKPVSQGMSWKRNSTLGFLQIEVRKTLRRLFELAITVHRGRRGRA